MVSGTFQVRGGFWQQIPAFVYTGDLNSDGNRNGKDTQQFVLCLTSGGACTCADQDGKNGPGMDDIGLFVTEQLVRACAPESYQCLGLRASEYRTPVFRA